MPNILTSITMVFIKDMDTSLDFYVNKLGFKEKVRYGNDWAVVSAPGMDIAFHPMGDMKIEKGYNMQMGFEVKDLEASSNSLKAKGIEVGFHQDDSVKLAPFTDPDGNQLYLWSY